MADGKRPGGLTALAVFNFIFGGLSVLAALALGFALANADELAAKHPELKDISRGMLTLTLVLTIASAVLLIASGVGYLKQKRFLGRTLGTIYAVLSLVSTVVAVVSGQVVDIGTIIGVIYPVLTLLLVNLTFKDDLVA